MSEGSAPLAVIGAINVDLVVSGAPLPRPGETVGDGTFARHHGGKGGNQATAAARALSGAGRVVMLGAVGDDDLGHAALDALRADGVDVARVHVAPDAPTGVALIAVNGRGENQISVAPGANHALGDPIAGLDAERPSLVLASCEVPYAALRAAADWCRANRARFVLNPAPVQLKLRALLDEASVVTPNEGEVVELAPGVTGVEPAARSLLDRTPSLSVLVTLGAEGVLLVDGVGVTRLGAPAVDVLDTTGAGDCLNGVLAAALWEGADLREAAARAVAAASFSVTRPGARDGMPTRAELDAFLAG